MIEKKPKTLVDISRDRCVTLERYLYRLCPRKSFDVVPDLLRIFVSVDVTLHRSIAQWLEPAFGWSRSASLVQSALRETICPLDFAVSGDGRPYLACFSRGGADRDSSDILHVPYTSPDGEAEGFIPAAIYEGNLINLRCQSAVTWQVFEINPIDRKIILAVHKRREIQDRESHLAWCVSEKGRAARTKNVPTIEKREFFPVELMGAIVWREGIDDAATDGAVCDDAESARDDSSSGTNSSSADDEGEETTHDDDSASSRRQVFQMPTTPLGNVLDLMSRSQSLMQSALRETTCPLDFAVSGDGRPYLACFSRFSKRETNSDSPITSDILQVPYTSPDAQGVIPAAIYEGHLVKLRNQLAVTYQVFEINPVDRKIILALHKPRVIQDKEIDSPPKGRAARAGNVTTVEKRECFPVELMGATVWREDLEPLGEEVASASDAANNADSASDGTSSGTESSSADDEDQEGTQNDISAPSSRSRCRVFQMPTTPWEHVLQLMKTLVKEQVSLHGSSKTSGPTTAQIQPAGMAVNHKKIQSDDMVNYSSREKAGKPESSNSSSSSSVEPDVQVTDAEHAQAQLWLQRKRDLIEARRLLRRADPFSCCLASCRDRWMLTCRALRAISRGDEDLLDDFTHWTGSAGEEGATRARDCTGMWRSLRPLTTADIPCVAQTRVFARAHMHDRRLRDGLEGRISNIPRSGFSFRDIEASCCTDPVLSSLIASAATVLAGRSLFFLSCINDSAASSVGQSSPRSHCPPGAMVVPAALYEATNLSSTHDSSARVRGSTQSEGVRLLQSGEVVASISAGDVVLLPSFQPSSPSDPYSSQVTQPSSSSSSSSSRKGTWHRVIAVDLFYARLRVSPCPPPPECWSRHVTLPSQWAPISCLWAVPVCQLMPPTSPESCLPVQYLIYVTPIPSLSASFAALASLPRKDKPIDRTDKTSPPDDGPKASTANGVKKLKKMKGKKGDFEVEIFYKEKRKEKARVFEGKGKRDETNLTGICNPPLKHK